MDSFVNLPPQSDQGAITGLTGDVEATGGGVANATLSTSLTNSINTGLTNNFNMMILNAMGNNFVGMNFGIGYPAGTPLVMADNTISFTAVYVPKDATISGVKLCLSVQGDYTADQENAIGLYSINTSTGILTKRASSANDGNLWKQTANTFFNTAFTTPYEATAGLYYIAVLYNQSAQVTAPRIYVDVIAQATQLAPMGTTYAKTAFDRSSANSLASTYDINVSMSNSARFIWCGLY